MPLINLIGVPRVRSGSFSTDAQTPRGARSKATIVEAVGGCAPFYFGSAPVAHCREMAQRTEEPCNQRHLRRRLQCPGCARAMRRSRSVDISQFALPETAAHRDTPYCAPISEVGS